MYFRQTTEVTSDQFGEFNKSNISIKLVQYVVTFAKALVSVDSAYSLYSYVIEFS